jgi:hypothetical protein
MNTFVSRRPAAEGSGCSFPQAMPPLRERERWAVASGHRRRPWNRVVRERLPDTLLTLADKHSGR